MEHPSWLADEGFSIGEFRVAPRLHRLTANGANQQVEPKVMAVLLHLAERAPEVVSPDELLDSVWGSRFASEDLPRRAVYELRKILADNPREPRYIETIPRSGYRLIAPPERLPAPPREIAQETRRSRSHRRFAPAAIAAVLLVAAFVSLALLAGDEGEDPATTPRPVPFTATPGIEYEPAFSPDGTRVAFLRTPSLESGAPQTLEVQLIGSESSVSLNAAPADLDHPLASPAWSPDGTTISYLRWTSGEGWGIHEVPAQGGSERKLFDLGRAGASGLAWSPDGAALVVGLRAQPEGAFALYRLDLASGEKRQLTEPPPTFLGDRWPSFSPDGKHLAFLRTASPDSTEVHLVGAEGGESRSLLPERHKIADVDWTDDGRAVLIAIHDAGRHTLWTVDVTTGQAQRRAGLGENTRWISAARTGGGLIYGRAQYEFGIRRLDLASGISTPVPALSSTFYDDALDLAPNGETLAFASTRSGSFEIWISDLEERRPIRLTRFDGPTVGHPRWYPDGKAVVFHAIRSGSYDVWRVGIEAGSPVRLTTGPENYSRPSVSGDGASVYMASDRSGSWQIWRQEASGELTQVTRHGGYHARESPDRQWLYYTRWRQPGLWRTPVGGGEEKQVLQAELSAESWGNWIPTDEGIYLVERDLSGQSALALYSPESGNRIRRIPLPEAPVHPSLTRSADGLLFLYAQLEGLDSDLVLVEGGARVPRSK